MNTFWYSSLLLTENSPLGKCGGKITVTGPVRLFMSQLENLPCHQLIRQTFRHYGKSNRNSRNWRYAAGLLVAQPCVRQSEIFLNFASQPTLHHLVISSRPPTQPPHLLYAVQPISSILFLSCNTEEKKGHTGRDRIIEADRTGQEGCTRTVAAHCSQSPSWMKKSAGLNFGVECCMICRLGMWTPSGALRSFMGHSHFSLSLFLSFSLLDWPAHGRSAGY